MLNNLKKNIKKITKQIPENFFIISSKSAIYFGLTIYWSVIILGTIFQIN